METYFEDAQVDLGFESAKRKRKTKRKKKPKWLCFWLLMFLLNNNKLQILFLFCFVFCFCFWFSSQTFVVSLLSHRVQTLGMEHSRQGNSFGANIKKTNFLEILHPLKISQSNRFSSHILSFSEENGNNRRKKKKKKKKKKTGNRGDQNGSSGVCLQLWERLHHEVGKEHQNVTQ